MLISIRSSSQLLAWYCTVALCWCALPLVLLWLDISLSAGWFWDAGNGLGFVAFSLCGYLFIERARPRRVPIIHGAFFIWWHKALAWVIFALASLHTVIFLVAEPLNWNYLSLRSPWYMLAGLFAWLLLGYLCISSIRAIRRRLHSSAKGYRLVHGALAILALLLSLYHIVAAGFYIRQQFLSWAMLFCILLVYFGLNRIEQRWSLASSVLHVSASSKVSLSNTQQKLLLTFVVALACLISGGAYLVLE